MKDYDSTSSDQVSNDREKEEKNTDEVRRCINEQEKEKENSPNEEDLEDNPLWDGSESEIIADDDALVYEEQQTGIKLDYILKYDEVLSCLRMTGEEKTITKTTKIKTTIAILLGVSFLVSYFVNYQAINLVLGSICLILALAVFLVPSLVMKNTAKEITSKEPMYVEVYPDNLVVGKNGGEREIPLDGSCQFQEFGNLFMIFPEEGEMIAIPIRAIEPDLLADVEAILTAGTERKE